MTQHAVQAVGRSAEQDDSDSDGYVSVRRLGKAPPAGKGKASVAHDSDSDDDLPPPRPVKSPPAHQVGFWKVLEGYGTPETLDELPLWSQSIKASHTPELCSRTWTVKCNVQVVQATM